MKMAKLINEGESQIVRLPKGYRFRGGNVFIKKMGSAIILWPQTNPWDPLLSSLEQFTPDFMSKRNQPVKNDKRDS